jgi:hypothetical protein
MPACWIRPTMAASYSPLTPYTSISRCARPESG